MKVLFSQQDIESRVREMGREISERFNGQDITLMILANGGIFFGVDLARAISIPVWVDVIGIASYTNDKKVGIPDFRCPPKLPVNGRHVIIVDDVLDTGDTVKYCKQYFLNQGAASVTSAVLMEKAVAKRDFSAEWKGFDAPDEYLVGSGMDSCEFYRNLDCVAVFEDK